MDDTKPSLRSTMIANGDSGMKIWVTEFGAPTDGPEIIGMLLWLTNLKKPLMHMITTNNKLGQDHSFGIHIKMPEQVLPQIRTFMD
jgi:hypothetical protein